MFMSGVVVGNQMQFLALGGAAIDLAQEAQPFLMTMLRLAVANDAAVTSRAE